MTPHEKREKAAEMAKQFWTIAGNEHPSVLGICLSGLLSSFILAMTENEADGIEGISAIAGDAMDMYLRGVRIGVRGEAISQLNTKH